MTLLDTAYSTLASNPLLVGGVGTLAFGSLMYLLRAVPEKMLDIIERTVWTKVFVESLSNEYRDVDAFIEGRRLDFFSRSLEIKDGSLKTGFGGGWGIMREPCSNIRRRSPINRSRLLRPSRSFS